MALKAAASASALIKFTQLWPKKKSGTRGQINGKKMKPRATH